MDGQRGRGVLKSVVDCFSMPGHECTCSTRQSRFAFYFLLYLWLFSSFSPTVDGLRQAKWAWRRTVSLQEPFKRNLLSLFALPPIKHTLILTLFFCFLRLRRIPSFNLKLACTTLSFNSFNLTCKSLWIKASTKRLKVKV